MSHQLPKSPTSKDVGAYLERTVADRLGFEHVEDDRAGFVDAHTSTGDPVDVKGARYRIAIVLVVTPGQFRPE